MSQSTVFDFSPVVRALLVLLFVGTPLLPVHAQYDTSQGPGGPLVAMPQVEVRPSDMTPEGRALLKTRSRDAFAQGARSPSAARRGDTEGGRELDAADKNRLAQDGQLRPRTSR